MCLLLVLQSTTANAAQSGFKSSLGSVRLHPTPGFRKIKSKTPSYVMTSRTNSRRWVQRGGKEEDGHRRSLCGGFTETQRRADGRARSSRMCALIRRTILLSPHTLLLPGRITPPTGCIVRWSHVWSSRTEACWVVLVALITPVPPCCSSRRISLSVPARPHSSNARDLERKLGLADRKSLIRFFFPFCPVSI